MYQVGSQIQRGNPENSASAEASVWIQLGTNKRPLYRGKSNVLRSISFRVPVQYKHTDPVLGELYQPLTVVPPVLVNLPPARSYIFADAQPRTVPVTLRAGRAGVSGSLALALPAGWKCEPATVPSPSPPKTRS